MNKFEWLTVLVVCLAFVAFALFRFVVYWQWRRAFNRRNAPAVVQRGDDVRLAVAALARSAAESTDDDDDDDDDDDSRLFDSEEFSDWPSNDDAAQRESLSSRAPRKRSKQPVSAHTVAHDAERFYSSFQGFAGGNLFADERLPLVGSSVATTTG